MRHPRYIVFAPPSKLQSLADRLNSPRGYGEDYPNDDTNELGLGPRTCRDDASGYGGLDSRPGGPPSHRFFTLSVKPQDVDRFESICEDIPGVQYDIWHPDGAGGAQWTGPLDFPRDQGLEKLPDESAL